MEREGARGSGREGGVGTEGKEAGSGRGKRAGSEVGGMGGKRAGREGRREVDNASLRRPVAVIGRFRFSRGGLRVGGLLRMLRTLLV